MERKKMDRRSFIKAFTAGSVTLVFPSVVLSSADKILNSGEHAVTSSDNIFSNFEEWVINNHDIKSVETHISYDQERDRTNLRLSYIQGDDLRQWHDLLVRTGNHLENPSPLIDNVKLVINRNEKHRLSQGEK